MVLAAGRGSRLAPLTDELPKPAIPVADRPMMAFALERLARLGVREVAVNAHHLAERLVAVARRCAPEDVELHFSVEPELLGTAGGIATVGAWLTEGGAETVVLNGDLLFEAAQLERALQAHRTQGAHATLLVRPDPEAARYGAVRVGPDGRVLSVAGRPRRAGPHEARVAYEGIFTGASILSAEAVASLPSKGCLVRDGLWRWLEAGRTVLAVADRSTWWDLGTLERYGRANRALAEGHVRWPGLPRPDERGLVHPSARVGRGATLRGCVVGADAEVAAGADLDGVVLWPGVVARGRLRDVVVTPQRIVPLVAGAHRTAARAP